MSVQGRGDGTPGTERDGAELITAERERQMAVEGWTPEHDDKHRDRELAAAAIAYAAQAGASWSRPTGVPGGPVPVRWPWKPQDWKPTSDEVRDLVKAGALIAAEIDRLQRHAR